MKIPVEFEPKRTYRFVIEFPKSMEIEPFAINGMSKLQYNFQSEEWDDVEIEIYDVVGQNNSQKITESLVNGRLKKFNFKLLCLDPVGIEFERFKIHSTLISANLGTYIYDNSDELSYIKLVIKPTYIEFLEPKKHD